ncbi:MAG: hypothetical protein ABEJ61_09895 [Haloferacaceae archaeon]
MAGILSQLRELVTSDPVDEGYEVDVYVLERRTPDPEPRVASYDEPVTPVQVRERDELPPGTYLLQEVKSSGMAGEVVWEEELSGEE